MKRIRVEMLKPGDIVLTADAGKLSKAVRLATRGEVSHAMICVQSGSVVDSTHDGVQAHNIQRQLYAVGDRVDVLRPREPLAGAQLRSVINFARSEIGTRYSNTEAAKAALPRKGPGGRRMFCSRLVARAYAHAGIRLVTDPDYCTPDDLRRSALLVQVDDMTEPVPESEIAAWAQRPNPISAMRESQNAILAVARRLDPSVENFNDLDRLVTRHPEWDPQIAKAYVDSGYLELWRTDFEINPWHYDLDLMEEAMTPSTISDLRSYCLDTIREFHSGGLRFAVNLAHYKRASSAEGRKTHELLVALYERLVLNDALRRDTALEWLTRHFPDDAVREMERIEPHSEMWFEIVDQVEPTLGQIARVSIAREGSVEVCSTCGDPPDDYLLANSPQTMPGVPSLRLCPDCAMMRTARGELLELL